MATTFYHQIAANKRNSLLLSVVVIALFAGLGLAIGYAWTASGPGSVFVMIGALALGLVIAGGSYFAGDGLVISASQAHPVDEATEPQLVNVVREMSIAANVPVPKVYITEDSAPNAFATGRDPTHASVVVTRGLLDKLDREELQGVLAHEMSHVRNYDIRYTLLVGVLVGSIALLADMYLRSVFWGGVGRGRGRGEGAGGAIIMVLALVLAVLAPIIARLVQLAVSRQREYLADASAVDLTRNPSGLERALEKIAVDREVLEVANRATQHLYFTNPIKKWEERSSGLWSTHPPIVERINRLRSLTGQAPLDRGGILALEGLD